MTSQVINIQEFESCVFASCENNLSSFQSGAAQKNGLL